MKLVRTLSMFIALAGASTAFAQPAPTKQAPAPEKKAPDKAAPAPDKAAPKDAPKEELSAADVKKAEAFFEELAGAVVKNQDACPKMAVAINAVFDKHEAWFRKMVESGKDVPQSTKDKMQKKQQEMMNGLMKCKDDKDVSAAFQRLLGVAAKKKDAPATSAPPAKK